MQSSIRISALVFIFGLVSNVAGAQASSPTQQLTMARALYYTPTTSGMKSLSCRVSIDWKGLLGRVAGQPIADDNPFLQYLNSVHMSVKDDIRTEGKLEWNSATAPPDNLQDSATKMQQGMAQMVEGFFQSWNAYLNGSMVPAPDKSTTVTKTDSGIRLHATSDKTSVDEEFDKNMLLTKAHVITDQMDVIAVPAFIDTPDGRVVSEIRNEVRQPASAPPMLVNMGVTYQTVSNRRIPQVIHYDVQNVMQVDLNLSECTVTSDSGSVSAPKP